ncbi:glycosyltransferase [Singulisphaera sp. Ch08]|uniref:Glycosyltransferase n=1 Tax=Singulisphaera sp. Ch08 TaxID=3120278 RepID=A0AAU7CC20_9BACT
MRAIQPSAWTSARSQGAMPPDSVLFHAPTSAFQAPGGGENQLVQTGKQLEDLGVTIRLFSPWIDRLEEARLLHLFGMSREGLELARVARARGIRVVLSPICWYEPRAIAFLAPNRTRELFDLAKLVVKRVAPRWPSWRRELLNLADMILPNSVAEAGQLIRLFAIEPGRIRVVPNGVQSTFTHASPTLFRSEYGTKEFVLYVGRIEPRKNVLRLVEAVSSTGLPLVVIGSPPPGSEAYAEACRRAGDVDVRWIDSLDHDDPLLASAYAAARVFALPSWFETPGLAALEAALAGCAVVITPFGCTREYFGERVEYARPDRPSQIARAILKSWEAGPDPRLASHVGSRFLWSDVAQRTAEVYDQIAG